MPKYNIADACVNSVANIWDIRAGRQMHKLLGHTKWIRLAIKAADLFSVLIDWLV